MLSRDFAPCAKPLSSSEAANHVRISGNQVALLFAKRYIDRSACNDRSIASPEVAA